MIILNYKKYCKLFLEKNLVVILYWIKIYWTFFETKYIRNILQNRKFKSIIKEKKE